MDYPQGNFLEFRPDTFHTVRKLYNLDKPGRMQEAVKILDEWVKNQKHFLKKDFSPIYLETSIIGCKGSLERSKRQVDKLCTYRTLLPHFFTKINVKNDMGNLYDIIKTTLLPKMTSDHYRIIFLKYFNIPFEASHLTDYYRFAIALSEYMRKCDYVNGIVFIGDFRSINLMEVVTKSNPVELRQAFTIFMEGYGMRLKGLHLISSSTVVNALVTLLKQILSEKLAKRIVVHKTVESLYDYVPQEVLPKEYGGKERSLKDLHAQFIDILSSEEHVNYLKEMQRAKTDESCRQVDKFNDQYAGMPGTFRALTVD